MESTQTGGGSFAHQALLEEQVAQLQQALVSRVVIEQAKGAVAARTGVTPGEAFELMRALSRSQNRKLRDFCAQVVENRGRLDGLDAEGRPALVRDT